MTQDDAVAILRKAGFDPRPVEQAGWPFAMPEEHRTTADDWWDPGHPLLARGEFIAMPTARLIALAQAVVYGADNHRSALSRCGTGSPCNLRACAQAGIWTSARCPLLTAACGIVVSRVASRPPWWTARAKR